VKRRINSAPAIVIGLDSLQGLQTARLLRARDIPVHAVAANRDHPACKTNVCEQIHFVDTRSEELIGVLEHIGRALPARGVLFPCQDHSVVVVSRHRSALERHFAMALPSEQVVEMLTDKVKFYTYAVQRGLPIPDTYLLRRPRDAAEASRRLTYPAILKPAFRSATWDRNTMIKVFRVAGADELTKLYSVCSEWAPTLLAQQWIEGSDAELYSCNCYFGSRGTVLASFVARKVRQWPPEAGSSCSGIEVRNDLVLQTAIELFGGLDYHGLGYLEMKRDARTGKLFVIEPNIGRPTGRSAIAEAGGVELLQTMYCDALGLPLPAERTQRYLGTKWLDIRHDVQSAFHYWRAGKLTLRELFASWRGRKAHAIFSWRDPRPFVHDLWRAGVAACSGRARVGRTRPAAPAAPSRSVSRTG
jgi:predicted ATP-grasp superfamily ATP-dependent carboligase